MNEKATISQSVLFIDRLEKLDAGDRARFKRNAGKSLSEASDALGLFYHLLPPGIPQYQEEIYFLLATIYPLAESGGNGDFGTLLAKAQNSSNKKGLDRRVEFLLDADTDQLAFRLRQSVHFLHSCRVGINWVQLLDDLLQWSHPDRYIQKRWARSYFSQSA